MIKSLAPAAATLGALAFAAGFSSIACGGERTEGSEAVVRVDLREWSVRASKSPAAAGPDTLEVRNRGRLGHELVIIKTDKPPATLPAPGGFVDERTAGEVMGHMYDLRRGGQRTQTFDLSVGNYVLICNVVGHYQLGMRAALEVR